MEILKSTQTNPNFIGDATEFVKALNNDDKDVKENIKILERLRSYIMPLSEENYRTLEESILANGVQDPILLWRIDVKTYHKLKTGDNFAHPNANWNVYVVIDGHNRYEICKKHGIDFNYKIKTFETIEEVEAYMDDWQMARRNLTPEQQSILRARIAKRKGFTHGGSRGQNVHLENREQIAKELGVSAKTLQRDDSFYNGLQAIKAYNRYGKDIVNFIISMGHKSGIDRMTVQNIGKALEKFPNEQMQSVSDLNVIYDKYRNSVAPQKPTTGNVPKPKNIAKGTTEKALEKQVLEHLHRPGQKYLDLTEEEQSKVLEIQVLRFESQIKNLKTSLQLEQNNHHFAVEMLNDKIKKLEEEIKYLQAQNKELQVELELHESISQYENLHEQEALQSENNDLKQEIADLKRAFCTSTTDERKKLIQKGCKLMRSYPHAPNFKINYLDTANFSWKLLEKFDTKAALDRRVEELRKDENIIFE